MSQEKHNGGFIDDSFCNNFKTLTENIAVISEPYYEATKTQGEEERMGNSQHELGDALLPTSKPKRITSLGSVRTSL